MLTPNVQSLIPNQVSRLWAFLEAAATEDGPELLRQPAATVATGQLAVQEYAIVNPVERLDFEQHKAAYGALILS